MTRWSTKYIDSIGRTFTLVTPLAVFFMNVLLTWSMQSGHAQEKQSANLHKLFLRSIEQLDSVSEEERRASEKYFQSVVTGPTAMIARSGLAFVHHGLEDPSAVLLDIEKVKLPELPMELQFAVRRLETCAAIAAANPSKSETRFKEIVLAALKDGFDMSQRRSCIELAAQQIEYLSAVPDASPIKAAILGKAHDGIMACSNTGLVQSYQSMRRDAGEIVEKMNVWIERLRPLDDQAKLALVDELTQNWSKLSKDYVDVDAEGDDATKNLKEVKRNNLMGTNQLKQDRNRILKEPPASGHPGHLRPAPNKPAAPRRESIRVNEFEYEVDKKTGERKKVRRSSSEINDEIDREYNRLRRDYEFKKRQYEIDIVQYLKEKAAHTELLNLWQEREQKRVQEAEKQLAEIEASKKRLDKEFEDAEASRKDAAAVFKAKRLELDAMRIELKIAKLALAAIQRNEPASAYRQLCMQCFSVSQEKPALKKAIDALSNP